LQKSEPLLLIEVQQSSALLVFLCLIHLSAILSIGLMSIVLTVKAFLLLGIIVSAYFYWWRYYNKFYCFSVKHSSESSWQLTSTDNDNFEDVAILKSTVITQSMIALHVKTNKGKKHLLILADAVNEECFRQLHVRLKIYGLS